MKSLIGTITALVPLVILFQGTVIAGQGDNVTQLTGKRVRVTAPVHSTGVIEGTVVEVNNGTLRLEDCRPNLDVIAVPAAGVRRLQVYNGRQSHAVAGMLVGTGAGLAAFALFAGSDKHHPGSEFDDKDQMAKAIAFYILVPGGFLIGTITGGLIHTDRWKDVPLERLQVRLGAVGNHGFGVSLAIGL